MNNYLPVSRQIKFMYCSHTFLRGHILSMMITHNTEVITETSELNKRDFIAKTATDNL